MRPIFWGIILMLIGAIGWVISVVLAVVTFGATKILANIFGIMFAISLPIALVAELIRWIRRRKNIGTR